MASLYALTKEDKQLARALTQLLRHGKPRKLNFRPDGFVQLEAVRAVPNFDRLSVELAQAICREDNKNRFSLSEEASGWWMRANQGHSIGGLNPEDLLQRITNASEISNIVHGTFYNRWPSIRSSGLSRMKRNHVHLARGLPGDDGVISGMRNTAEILIYVDAAKAMEQGIVFFVSENDVVLTTGPVPTSCFSRVVDRGTGTVIFNEGVDADVPLAAALLQHLGATATGGSAAASASAEADSHVGVSGVGGGKGRGKGQNRGGKLPPGLFLPGKGGKGLPGKGGPPGGRRKWPELVGKSGGEAKAIVESEAPHLKVVVVPEGSMVTMDHNLQRVRIYINASGAVARPPKLG